MSLAGSPEDVYGEGAQPDRRVKSNLFGTCGTGGKKEELSSKVLARTGTMTETQ